MSLVLYSYFRSSAAYRVRIALNWKGLPYRIEPVHLVRDGGQQHAPAFHALNPQDLVPVLIDGDVRLTQSLAILDYLEETHPERPLLPAAPADRAYVRQLALAVACEIHPVTNLRVRSFVTKEMKVDKAGGDEWMRHWTALGLAAFEAELAARGPQGNFCFGDSPSIADCCLIPQLYNARRWELDLTPYPRLVAIEAACNSLLAFQAAHPAQQIDAE